MADLLRLGPGELLTITRAVRRHLIPVAYSIGTDFTLAARLDWRELVPGSSW